MMAGQDMNKELEQLRAEVAELAAARASKNAAETQAETIPPESQLSESEEVSEIIGHAQAAVEADAELKGQFDQLFEQLEHDIKDLPAITTLAVFSLGVLFGRLLR
jgi:hypothetical protein